MIILLFSLSDFFTVQGSTEPYYVYRYLSQRHQVMAFVPIDDGPRPNKGICFIKRWRRIPTFLAYNLKVIPALLRNSARHADIIYTYKGVITPVLVLKFLFRKKWVCDFRTSPVAQEVEFRQLNRTLSLPRRLIYTLARRFYKLTLRYCDLVVAISKEVKEELINEYGVPSDKIHVQPLGVDMNVFKPKGKAPPIQEELRLIYVGAIALQRGLDIVIKALHKLKGTIPLKLLIVGRGSQEAISALKRLAQQFNVENLVDWRDYVPHEQIPDILDSCHIALSPLPKLRAYEVSSPSKVFEYLAMGKVCIATDILAHRKIIRDGWNGLLVPPEDPKALVEAIKRVYREHTLRETIMSNARKSVQKYNWDIMLPNLETRIMELMKNNKKPC